MTRELMLNAVIPELVTDRLLLRAFQSSDFDAYATICADPRVRRYLGDGQPLDRVTAWREMAFLLGHWGLRGFGQWALIEHASGELVGRAGLWEPEGWPGVEVGWVLSRAHWGQGFATEAASAALGHAFGALGMQRVISLIHPDNRASIRVAERLGERYEQPIVLAHATHHLYAIDRARWSR